MKKMFRKILLLIVVLIGFALTTLADPPGPPGPGGDPGSGGTPVGAPIDNGVFVLIILGVGYAAWKLYSAWKKKPAI